MLEERPSANKPYPIQHTCGDIASRRLAERRHAKSDTALQILTSSPPCSGRAGKQECGLTLSWLHQRIDVPKQEHSEMECYCDVMSQLRVPLGYCRIIAYSALERALVPGN